MLYSFILKKSHWCKPTISLWDSKIQQANEFSLSQLWILGVNIWGGPADINTIEAGWQEL